MMKRLLWLALMTVPTLAWADFGAQIVGFAAAPFAENPETVERAAREYRDTDPSELYGGVEIEFFGRNLGAGARYSGRFINIVIDDAAVAGSLGDSDNWWYDWSSDLFLSYHLFGGGAFLDPFVRYGVGIAMRMDLQRDAYLDEENGEWVSYREPDAADYQSIESAGFYQYLGLGVQLNLGGLVIGAGANYNILTQSASPEWDRFPSERFEARLYGGVSFGG